MDNVILVTFEDEGRAYEEFNRLKDNEATADFTILEMAVVKNVDGAIMVPDGFQDGYDETDNTAFGGVIGAVVGLLGGPVGVLLGAGIGLVAGMAMDDKDINDDDSLMEYCASELTPGATALVMLAKEDSEDNIDILQQRSRDADMGIPTATAALKTMRTNVVAGGLMPAPQLDSDYLGLDETAVEKLQAQFVREFALWADTPVCDAERMDNFYRSSSSPF